MSTQPLRTPAFLRDVVVDDAPHAAGFLRPRELPPIAAVQPPPPKPAPPPVAPAAAERPAPPPRAEPPPELLARLATSVETLRLQSERLAAQARADALEIGFQVARKILEIELSTSAEPLFALVRSAVRRAGEGRTLTVRLHPADAELVNGSSTGGLATIHVQPDPRLERGDCVVESDVATVDGRIETRLAELQRSLEGALAE